MEKPNHFESPFIFTKQNNLKNFRDQINNELLKLHIRNIRLKTFYGALLSALKTKKLQ